LIPWYLKIPAKIVLSRLPFSHQTMFQLGMFKHGTMQKFDYARDVFTIHLNLAGINTSQPIENQTILELGPGESLATAILAKSYGFDQTILVDVDRFALPTAETYKQLAEWITNQGWNDVQIHHCASTDEILSQVNASYRTNGLSTLKDIPDQSVDFIFSQAVLEHVRKRVFTATLAETYRIFKTGWKMYAYC
jgi:hypothetical protein